MDMLIPELVSITPAGAFPLLQCSSAQESVVFSNPAQALCRPSIAQTILKTAVFVLDRFHYLIFKNNIL